MQFQEICTERLILRKITEETYHEIFNNCADDEIKSLLGLASDEALTKEREKYQGGITTHNKKILYFQLWDKKHENILGWCGFHTWYIEHFRAEIGYGLFDDSSKRKGFMTEAIYPIVRYGFEQMNLRRIEAFVAPYNEPSLKLLRKLKFKQEGLLKQHYYTNKRLEDSIIFGLLKPDFEQ